MFLIALTYSQTLEIAHAHMDRDADIYRLNPDWDSEFYFDFWNIGGL